MIQEDKQLSLIDLCARFHYGVKVMRYIERNNKIEQLIPVLNFNLKLLELYMSNQEFIIKPYLRSMSSMTDEEKYELRSIFNQDIDFDEIGIHILNRDCNRLSYLELQAIVNFFYSHHLDWCGMIPKGLALEAQKDMYKEQNMKYGRE